MIARVLSRAKHRMDRCLRGKASVSSLPSLEDSHQCGYGKIVATSSPRAGNKSIATNLTEISHSSPMRLVPSRRSYPTHYKTKTNYEAAVVHLSSYGGGFVPGDNIELDIDVRGNGAVVYVLTQGGTRIYRPGDQFRQHGNYSHRNQRQLNGSLYNSSKAKLCKSRIHCTVEPGSTLFFLPDPTVPYYQTSFEEQRVYNCKYSESESGLSMGSIIAVDWYGSGRRQSTGLENERWAFDYLSTRAELNVINQQVEHDRAEPILIESMTLDNTCKGKYYTLSAAAISMGKCYDSYATILLHGPHSFQVASRAAAFSTHLASLKTRVRQGDFSDGAYAGYHEKDLKQLSTSLGGKVLMSMSPINTENQINTHEASAPQSHLVRILAESNEDIYRILHFCLSPCSEFLGGLEPYKDRIHSSGTVRSTSASFVGIPRSKTPLLQQKKTPEEDLQAITNNLMFGKEQLKQKNHINGSDAWFHACLFSDSALPVGSFAHSIGTEAASQLGLFSMKNNSEGNIDNPSCSEDDLADYIYTVSRSNARFSIPIILSGYSLVGNNGSVEQTHKSWEEIDAYVDRLLKSNGPGSRASLDQGLGFLRIAPSLLKRNDSNKIPMLWEHIRDSISDTNAVKSLNSSSHTSQSIQSAKGHAAPMYGVLAGSLGLPPLDACRVFAFGAARDSVSAAVRLNLIGPVAGLSLLNNVGRDAVEIGLKEGLLSMATCTDTDMPSSERYKKWLRSASTCAPLMDLVQPCHDLLSVRLFRT